MSLFKLSDHVVGTYTQFVCSSCLCPSPLVQESDVPLKILSFITCVLLLLLTSIHLLVLCCVYYKMYVLCLCIVVSSPLLEYVTVDFGL